ncbi:hypothetical protein FRC03_000336 [Tulasnella sp. 419]|nr:hypothetical protein FRC02_008992 [Tulasnella sp. 418]KAG8965641.1 hypothetical protein FRC03_000336 [Tulasnella sp. 419]
MIANLSKLLTVQLSPLFALVSTFLVLFTFLAPVPVFNQSIALVSIVPSSGIFNQNSIRSIYVEPSEENNDLFKRRLPRAAAAAIVARASDDGLKMRFGLLGSCFKHGSEKSQCTTSSLDNPTYDLSPLPATASSRFPSSPSTFSPNSMLACVILTTIFMILISLPSMPKLPAAVGATLEKPIISRLIAWIGVVSWLDGMITTVVLRINFGVAVQRFNEDAANARVALTAEVSNGFTMLWIAFALLVPALICSMFKLHLEAKKA